MKIMLLNLKDIFKTGPMDTEKGSEQKTSLQGRNDKTFEEFCNVTTLHGFSYLTVFKMFWQKCLWSLVVVAAFGGVTFHLYYLVSMCSFWLKIY